MTVNTTFRTLAFAMRNAVPDTYMLLAAADAVGDTVEGLIAQGVEDAAREHRAQVARIEAAVDQDRADLDRMRARFQRLVDGLRTVAENDAEVVRLMQKNQKINAIKALRARTGADLMSAKDAIMAMTVPEPLADWERELLHGDY